MDNETSKILEGQKKIVEFTMHEGWPLVKEMLRERIEKFYDTREVKGATATDKGKQLEIRTRVAQELEGFVNDIEGVLQAYEYNKTLEEKDTYIVRS